MKRLDTSGFESSFSAPLGGSDELAGGFSTFKLPSANVSLMQFDAQQKKFKQMLNVPHRTTAAAFSFKKGVIVATSSPDNTASQAVKDIIEINPYMLATTAGGPADCQFWLRDLASKCRLAELANKQRISVAGASKLLASTIYSYRGMGLSVDTMIAGWDESGPGLYRLDSEGGRLKGTQFCVGSGSPYAYSVLDSGYNYDMSIEEAAELGRRSIYHATLLDGSSGGVVIRDYSSTSKARTNTTRKSR